ncbi:MAG TPA: aromatic ring-hydroxylating dioxygenase subunit alpha [Candidatus Binataceae bacterium]|nr:aromatic ring-hydroxylating dioxygenase subunit alpha [Candidatus Binataceae bacterium]
MATSIEIDRTVGAGLERGLTLPASWYTDAAIFEAEKQRIFGKFWQYVGHSGQVPEPGDFFTVTLGDIPVIVVRNDDRRLRAFANVCRHRGSEVVLGCSGNRKTMQCHYHGWTYNLDGTLRAAPRSGEQLSFDKSALSLISFSIDTWGPFIFVNPDPAALPLASYLGKLPSFVARAALDVNKVRMVRRDEYQLASNWKIIIENFNECYHCPIAHPKFSSVIDTDAYSADTTNEFFSTYNAPLIHARDEGVGYATLWPTAMLSLSTNPGAMQVLCVWPIDPGHTRETVDYYFAEDATEEHIREYVEFSDLVQREDIILCESVQRGHRSGAVERGHLMLSREGGIQHFQKLVHRFVAAEAEKDHH